MDIFSKGGKCGGKDACPRDKNENVCFDNFEKNYKFYFSFENSICKDYVAEKFSEMMERNIGICLSCWVEPTTLPSPLHIPILTLWITHRRTIINALDYTPHELANYLADLDRNDALYAEYF